MIGKETSIIDNIMLLYVTNNYCIICIIYTSNTCVPMYVPRTKFIILIHGKSYREIK